MANTIKSILILLTTVVYTALLPFVSLADDNPSQDPLRHSYCKQVFEAECQTYEDFTIERAQCMAEFEQCLHLATFKNCIAATTYCLKQCNDKKCIEKCEKNNRLCEKVQLKILQNTYH